MSHLRSAKRTLFTLLFILIATSWSAFAQNTTGSIVGTVTDPSGAAVPNATVTITNLATSEVRTLATTDVGEYQALNLVPGRYKLDVESTGFKHFTRNPVEVQVELSTRINVEMPVGSNSEQVTVTSEAPIIQSENAALGQAVEGRAVTEMPLNGRNVLALVGLVPGVVPQGSSGGNLTGQNVFAAGNYQIGGGTSNQSSTLFDGAPVNISYGNITSLVPSQDAVQEFRVQTSNNTAEYGNYSGGVINISSKSGSNSIHGTVYEYVRNTIFNSTPYFAKHNPLQVLPKNPYHQNQFGANIGFPIIKDKMFGFFDYQGYRQSQKRLYNYTVPTLKERAGDFTELCSAGYDSNNVCRSGITIYDPCPVGTPGGQGCPGTGSRTPIAYNGRPGVLNPARFSNVAKSLLAFPYYAQPTNGNLTQNFVNYAGSGGVNDQYTGRVDFALSDKQRLFGRYTQWNSSNIGAQPYNNGLIGGDPISPEAFKTRQVVVGDTYLFNSSMIGDLRLSYLRWTYVRTPGTLGYNETQLGFPSYMGTISGLNRVPNSTTVPTIGLANPTINGIGTGYIFGTNQNYVIAPTLSKTIKGHTIKGGADLRRMEMLYFQNNNPGGSFQFDPNMTASAAAGATGNSGNPFASFLLGYMINQANTASIVQIAPPTYNTVYYQGYYVQDNWQVSPKLTLNVGIRYDIPGVYRERNGLLATFNPTAVNSALGAVSVNGRAITGGYDLVSTPAHPDAGLRPEHFNNFSPRLGLAYRVNDNTVVRAGWGRFFIPSTNQFPESSAQSPLSYITNNPVATLDNGATPNATLDNPLPSGITPAPGRGANYQQLLLGGNANTLSQQEENGVTYQWNFAIQRQLPLGLALEAAYAGLHGSNLPVSRSINQVSKATLDQAHADPACFPNATTAPTANCFLTRNVTNPFTRSLFNQGPQQYATISSVVLNKPFPQYQNISNTGNYVGVSNYNALQLKVEKRFNSGGVLLGSYSFSKLLTNADSLTSWLEVVGAPGFQNTNNLDGEYSLSGYDARQRLVVSYVYSLPFGRGQHFGAGVTGFADKLVSGWGVNGVTTFQKGFPLGVSSSTGYVSTYSGTGTTRPNVVAGCTKTVASRIQDRLGDKTSGGVVTNPYFNTACFTAPDRFTFGNESRTDNTLRLPGIANYDLALFKDTHITERVALQLRVESFNLFNRVQFGGPNTSVGAGTNGQITTQANDPRLLQLAGRINF